MRTDTFLKAIGWAERHERVCWGIAVALLLLSAGLVVWERGAGLRYPDERDYWTIARNLVEQRRYSLDGVHPTAQRPPVYPFVLAAVRWMGGDVAAAKLLNVLWLGLTAVAIRVFFLKTGRARASCFAALFMLLYPMFLYTAATLYPQTMAGLLLTVSAATLYFNGGGAWKTIGGSAALAALVLTAPVFAFMLPVAGVALFLAFPARTAWKRLAILCIVFVAIVTPWAVRNARVFGAFIPIATLGGFNLLLGNSEHATPFSGAATDISAYARAADLYGLNEPERDAFYRQAALNWIRRHPVKALKLYTGKVLHHFHFRNRLVTQAEQARWRDLLLLATYYPHLGLLAFRMLRRKDPFEPWEVAFLFLYFGFALVSGLAFTRLRFRVPLDCLLLMVSARTAEGLVRRSAQMRSPEKLFWL